MLKRFSTFKPVSSPLDIWSREVFGSAKIDYFNLMLICKQNIFRLQIAVHYLVLVMDDGNSLEDVTDVVAEQRLSNYAIKL